MIFHALGDATRRRMIHDLAEGERTVSQLAEPFAMSLAAASKHIKVLEAAGLVSQVPGGRLGPRRLEDEVAWIEGYRQLWDARFDELDEVVEELKRKEKVDGHHKRE